MKNLEHQRALDQVRFLRSVLEQIAQRAQCDPDHEVCECDDALLLRIVAHIVKCALQGTEPWGLRGQSNAEALRRLREALDDED